MRHCSYEDQIRNDYRHPIDVASIKKGMILNNVCPPYRFRRCWVIAICFIGVVFSFSITESAFAFQPETLSDVGELGDGEKVRAPTILNMVFGGNGLGIAIVVLILSLSVISVYFIIEHFLTITRNRVMPDAALSEIEAMIIHGEINKAIDLCHQKENYSLSSEVILAGLERYKSSEFGYAEYRSAVEEAGEDQTGKLYRRTEVLNVIGAIAPMLGLTGTVLGMIEAFTTIASLEGMARPQELAGGIGQALITTLLGLLVAIPTMVAFSYFRNKIDSLVAEAGKRIEQIMMPLGRKK